ncbi:hypothetical protein EJ08DRAFT_658026 [Tothia fuscella]|uniref:Uncharacterized protein n=1 Tax=Tothia fuscella TaxID=1048955 RepID=A0A9P4U1Z9_9PEZI|nr:hypothetical protein EJ08DRAFT_658026 [Tothia fuscella]
MTNPENNAPAEKKYVPPALRLQKQSNAAASGQSPPASPSENQGRGNQPWGAMGPPSAPLHGGTHTRPPGSFDAGSRSPSSIIGGSDEVTRTGQPQGIYSNVWRPTAAPSTASRIDPPRQSSSVFGTRPATSEISALGEALSRTTIRADRDGTHGRSISATFPSRSGTTSPSTGRPLDWGAMRPRSPAPLQGEAPPSSRPNAAGSWRAKGDTKRSRLSISSDQPQGELGRADAASVEKMDRSFGFGKPDFFEDKQGDQRRVSDSLEEKARRRDKKNRDSWRVDAKAPEAQPEKLTELRDDCIGAVCVLPTLKELVEKRPDAAILQHPDFSRLYQGSQKSPEDEGGFVHPCVVLDNVRENGLVLCAQITGFSSKDGKNSIFDKYPKGVEALKPHRRRWLLIDQPDGHEPHDGLPVLEFKSGRLDKSSYVNTQNFFWLHIDHLDMYMSKEGTTRLTSASVDTILRHHDELYGDSPWGRRDFLQAET